MLHCFDPIRTLSFWAILVRLTLAIVCGGVIGGIGDALIYMQNASTGGLDFVTMANNHTRDFGDGAYQDTCAALDAVGDGFEAVI